MIKRTEIIEIKLTPREVAEIIIDMADDEQADMLSELADYHTFHFANFVMQLECIREVLDNRFIPEDKKRIKRMFDSFVEYIEEIDWDGDTEHE